MARNAPILRRMSCRPVAPGAIALQSRTLYAGIAARCHRWMRMPSGEIEWVGSRARPAPHAHERTKAMPIQIMMPALSPTMEKGKLLKWLVSEGQMVNPGDAVAEIETEKATVEVEAVDQGKVAKLLVPEGTEGVKVNTPIALLEGGTPGATLKTHVRARAETVKMTTAGVPVRTEPRSAPALHADTALGAGAVIGRSRLVGDHGPPASLGRAMSGLTPSEESSEPKTQYIRSGAIDADPVAG